MASDNLPMVSFIVLKNITKTGIGLKSTSVETVALQHDLDMLIRKAISIKTNVADQHQG